MKSMKSRRLLIAALGLAQQTTLVAGALFGFGAPAWSWCWTNSVYRGGYNTQSLCHGSACQYWWNGSCSTPQVKSTKRCNTVTWNQWVQACSLPNDPQNCNVLPQQQVSITDAFYDNNQPCGPL